MDQHDNNSLQLVHAAAHRGVAEAQAIYGQMLLDGRLLPQNATAALHWFERAALGGHLMAVNMVGRCLDQGWGVTRSPQLAASWFRKAAERGLDWGMYNLAILLTEGSGVPQDRVEALYWLRKAAEQNHAKSVNLVGSFYEDGWVVARDLSRARECYRRAAEGGDFRGHFNYARMLAAEGDIAGALSSLRRVHETATPAFMAKMKHFLLASSARELQAFAATIPGTPAAA